MTDLRHAGEGEFKTELVELMLVKVQVLLDLMRYEDALETLSEVKEKYSGEAGVVE